MRTRTPEDAENGRLGENGRWNGEMERFQASGVLI